MKKLILVLLILLLAAGCDKTTNQNSDQSNTQSNVAQGGEYCSGQIQTESGESQYPINPKYKKLTYLGRLFTANDCGEARLKEVVGSDDYALGSSIVIKGYPGKEFREALTTIGFECSEEEPSACLKWSLKKTVKAQDLVKLWRFHPSIESDDCVNCGKN